MASQRVMPITADLEAQYAARNGQPIRQFWTMQRVMKRREQDKIEDK
jgi:hypothetical protein